MPDSETPKIDKVNVLGIEWKIETDNSVLFFGYFIENCENIILVKRNILCILARIYFPVDWIQPIIIKFKLLFQEIFFIENWIGPENFVISETKIGLSY